jgi:hypothetical protein
VEVVRMFDRRERAVMRLLRGLARQRVSTVLAPGTVYVIEMAPDTDSEGARAAIGTCQLRGWVDVLWDNMPHASLGPGGELPTPLFQGVKPFYRLTDSGWAAINRSHGWARAEVLVALIALVVAVVVAG